MLEEEIQKDFDGFINHCSTKPKEVMLRTLRQAHPALQEKFTELMFSWIKEYANNCPVDDRNKHTVNECRRILKSYKNQFGVDLI